MPTTTRVNPLKNDALTVDTVKTGDHIVCWLPGQQETVKRLTILDAPYTDDEGYLVIPVRHSDGHESLEPTSAIGLSGHRYNGEWSVIAIIDDQEQG